MTVLIYADFRKRKDIRYMCVDEKLFEETVIFIFSFFVTSKSNLIDSIVNTTYLKSSTVFLRTKRIEQLQMKDPGTDVSYIN